MSLSLFRPSAKRTQVVRNVPVNLTIRNVLTIFLALFMVSTGSSQTTLYEDSFFGGVTSGGYGQEIAGTSDGVIEVAIDPGSTIRQAWLLVGRLGDAPDVSF
ncbi:MAG: hypothetical protein HRT74_08295, partial [Flavobacteriales bacterium]|nr:hypothetical protein [Flavobacteriales bacterium]